ncbi:BON domain-containing protein [Legionella sp. 16cNR16C]|uniref:BON domain-containing protein n=1 Tax=Legionella sp. 16cNR16C TaxID=2905656 RepID=UPI001E604C48|nr:BON domain-containing protein [Legionella sp. 16cNR16C]MCE3046304.1 BON domain-containing protein [Legionella sp. 16cNR16C]
MKFRALCFLLISALLSGCVAAVVAGAAAGAIVYDRRSLSMLESDARIYHLVHKEIVTDPQFADSRISVVSFNQIVLLVGQTPTASLRVMAEKIAQRTPHVRRVYDEITLGHPLSMSQQTRDSWMTSQVRSRMLTRKNLESGSIRVVTENAVVYLMGIVTQEQGDLAVEVARQVPGVQKVVKVFQYIT